MPQTCPRHTPDDTPDMPQRMPQTCPRHAPDDAPDMPQTIPQTCPRWCQHTLFCREISYVASYARDEGGGSRYPPKMMTSFMNIPICFCIYWLKCYKWDWVGNLWTHLCYEHRSAVLIRVITMQWFQGRVCGGRWQVLPQLDWSEHHSFSWGENHCFFVQGKAILSYGPPNFFTGFYINQLFRLFLLV